jgi:hypothetical protein
MRKYFLPPQTKTFSSKAKDIDTTRQNSRMTVKVNDTVMVIPDTYEKEKWLSPKNKMTEKEIRIQDQIK